MRPFIFCILLSIPFMLRSQHTFSIVAIDSVTGEIGSAGATCGDDITWPGTGGAILISDVLPGIGAIHTQSYYLEANQNNARQQMEAGADPESIINWLVENDIQNNPGFRQYGIVGFIDGQINAAAFTGANCLDEKDHRIGPNYAIQGNILLSNAILDSMEQAFLSATGPLSDRLMAAMQGANVPGADSRCLIGGVSSLSAFLRVAKPQDSDDQLWLDLNIPFTPSGVDPIDALQSDYDNWKATSAGAILSNGQVVVSPQPATHTLRIDFPGNGPRPDRIQLYNQRGELTIDKQLAETTPNTLLETGSLASGLYILFATREGRFLASCKVAITGSR